MRRGISSTAVLFFLLPSLHAQSKTSMEMFYDSTPSSGYAVATGDFNEDGKLDYVMGGASMTLRTGNGDGTFQTVSFGGNGNLMDIAVADLNKDGHLDVVALEMSGNVSIYLGRGDGTFQTAAPITFPSNVLPESVAVGDFNGDGVQDVAVGMSDGTIGFYNNVGGNSFILSKTVAVTPGSSITTVRAGDIDANGTVDLAVGTTNGAYVLWGQGNEAFTTELLKQYSPDTEADAFLGDLNSDGHPDIIVNNDCTPPNPGKGNSNCTTVDVWYGGQGTQKTFYRNALTAVPLGVYVSDLRAVDINGDGIADIAVSARDNNGSQEGMFFFLGNPDGSFTATPERYIATSDGVANFALGDFNRDGMMDVVQILDSVGAVEVYLNSTARPGCATSAISPTVTVCSPVDGTYSPTSVSFVANTYDTHTVTALQLYDNGNLIYNQPVTSFSMTQTVAPGQHLFVTKAWDYTGMSFMSPRNVTVYKGTAAPVCAAPPNGAAICMPAVSTGGSARIVANGNTSYVPTAVQVYIDGQTYVNDTHPTTGIQTRATLAQGSHEIVYKLWDASGNVAQATKTVTVQ